MIGPAALASGESYADWRLREYRTMQVGLSRLERSPPCHSSP